MTSLRTKLEAFLETNETLALVLLGVLTVGLRLACVTAIEIVPISDFFSYLTMASNLYDGHEMTDEFGNYAHMSAGYPYFLYAIFLITGKSVLAAKLASVVLSAVTMLLIYKLGLQCFGKKSVAYLGATAWTLYAQSIIHCEILAKENLMIPMMLGVLVLLMDILAGRRPLLRSALAGAILGLLLVVAASGLVLLPVAGLAILFSYQSWGKRFLMLGVFGLACLLALTPWFTRTTRLFGRALLTTTGGMNLWIGNHDDENPIKFPATIPVGDTGLIWSELRKLHGEDQADQIAKKAALDYIKAHPIQTLKLMGKKLIIFWTPPAKLASDTKALALGRMVWQAQHVLICLLAVIGILGSLKAWRSLWMIYLTLALYVLLHMVMYVNSRYRMAIEPLVYLMGAQGLWILLGGQKSTTVPTSNESTG